MSSRTIGLIVFLSVASHLNAQVFGRVTGSVLDATGSAIPDATVDVLLQGGAAPVLTTTTTSDGQFQIAGVRPETYDIRVSAKGFARHLVRAIIVDPARETVVPAIRLELESVSQSIDVTTGVQAVQTSNAEVSTTVTNQQVRRLPLLDRDVVSLILTQPGVVSNGNSNTVINGQRTSYSNVTLDGINIQDNFIRGNALDFQPNLLLLDQVKEFSLVTSNGNASLGGGASQVVLVSQSGTNQFHGAAYWYNRNNAVAASDWFANQDGTGKPFLNQNQIGGYAGGPIIKDKLFFYTNYEAFRHHATDLTDRTILTADARNGIFTYQDAQGRTRKVDILRAARQTIDPTIQQIINQIPGPEKINNFRTGDSSNSLLRNTAGYSFLIRDNRTRDNVSARLDYVLSTKHNFTGSYVWNRDIVDRPDTSNDYSAIPKVINYDHTRLLSIAWRWNPTPRVTNELRGGFNLAPGTFETTQSFPAYLLDIPVFDNPVNSFRRQGRDTNTYNLNDGATYVRGSHTIQFGFQMQQVRVAPFNDGGTLPEYALAVGTGHNGLTASQLPGAGASDAASADDLLATLAGFVDSFSQNFNVTSRTSGFVPGVTNLRHYSLNNYAGYAQDNWKVNRRLALTLGLRYEYYSPVDERDALTLLPVLENNNPINTLLDPGGKLDFAGNAVGRPLYKANRKNFAPHFGLAWDVFGNSKTAIRGGYSIHYVNDEYLYTIRNSANTNSGLVGVSADSGLTTTIRAGLPRIPVPQFQVPLTYADDYNNDPTSAFGLPNPNLRNPYVQEWSFGVQQAIKGTVIEARYVGNHATRALRAFDYNQVIIKENGFLDDFQRAQNNGNLARNATGQFDPRFNARVPGSQRLTVFPLLDSGGFLTDSTVRNLIDQGQIGDLATLYQVNGLNGAIDFFRNPNALGTNIVTNFSNSTYHALQVDVRRQVQQGLAFQANYSFSKVLSDAAGDGITRFEPFMDLNNTKRERARAPFDLTHVINANAIYDLPIGKGHRVNYRPLDRVLSGWSASGIMTWESGAPISILSNRATLNRSGGGRSASNTAVSALNKSQLDGLIQFRMTGSGPYVIAAPAIGPDGRGVAPDGSQPFNGQAFFNPAAGTIGTLQQRMFSGPWVFGLDFGLQKTTHITERHSVELRMEAQNILNHPAFFAGDQNINSTQFGQIASTFFGRRLIQFGLYYRF